MLGCFSWRCGLVGHFDRAKFFGRPPKFVQHAGWAWWFGERFQVVDGEVGRKFPPCPIELDGAHDTLGPELVTLHVSLSKLKLSVTVPAVLVVLPHSLGFRTVGILARGALASLFVLLES
jgi:hypothetical protein